jgi:hypothetical protein
MGLQQLAGAALQLALTGELQDDRRGRLTFSENWQAANVSILVGFWSGDECRKVCNTLRRGRPLSECPAACRTHEQNRGVVERNVREGVAVLARYLTLLSAFCQVFIERHTLAFSKKEQEGLRPQRQDRYAGRSNLLDATRSAKALPLVTIVCDPNHGWRAGVRAILVQRRLFHLLPPQIWLRQSESWPSLAHKPDSASNK